MKAVSLEHAGGSSAIAAKSRTHPSASHIVLKAVMAASGFLMFGFLLAHLSGNLLVFSGSSAMNQYAEFLHGKPLLLWGARVGLLTTVLVHASSALVLARSRKRAHPVAYQLRSYQRSSFAARTMLLSGGWIAGFIVLHILHFTTGSLHAQYRPGEPFQNLVYSFQSPAAVAAYVLTMCLIAAHLFHGLWSMFQTLGWNDARRDGPLRKLAAAFSILMVALFSSVPLSIYAGIVTEGM